MIAKQDDSRKREGALLRREGRSKKLRVGDDDFVDLTSLEDVGDGRQSVGHTRHFDAPLFLNSIVDFGSGLPNAGCLSIQDIVENNSGDLAHALFANFMIDLEWMLTECTAMFFLDSLTILHGEKGGGKLLLEKVAQGLSTLDRSQRCGKRPVEVHVHAPPLPLAFGTFHAKAMLLHYRTPEKLRVAITTANFVAPDWWHKNQATWVQDFPPLPQPHTAAPSVAPSATRSKTDSIFRDDLKNFLRQCGGPTANWMRTLDRFDFSMATARIIASVPGHHTGANLSTWGHLKLRSVLSSYPLPTLADSTDSATQAASEQSTSKAKLDDIGKRWPVICQFSSLGSLTENWLFREFYGTLSAAACCTSRNVAGTASASSGGRSLSAFVPSSDTLKIIIPTAAQVRTSVEGLVAGAAIPIQKKNLKPFLFPFLHKWGFPYVPAPGQTDAAVGGANYKYLRARSVRSRAMPHVKMYLRYCVDDESAPDSHHATSVRRLPVASSSAAQSSPSAAARGDSAECRPLAWIVCGSHNLSKAAWGEMQKNASQLAIRSYELAVLVSPRTLAGKVPRPKVQDSSQPNFFWDNADGDDSSSDVRLCGISLLHSAPTTTKSNNCAADDDTDAKPCRRYDVHLPFAVPPIRYTPGKDVPWNVNDFGSGIAKT